VDVFDALGLTFHTVPGNEIMASNRIFFTKGLQSSGVSLARSRFRLHLHGKPVANDEIDSMSVSGTPKAEGFPRSLIAEGAPDLHRQKMLEASPEEVGIAFEMLRPSQGVRNPRVEEVKLRPGDRFSTFGLDPGKECKADQRIFEKLIMLANRRRGPLRVAGNVGEIDQFAVGERRRLQEAVKGGEPPVTLRPGSSFRALLPVSRNRTARSSVSR